MTDLKAKREEWKRKYIAYLDACTGETWQRYQLEQMASVAADSWLDDDPEEIASSDLHCMRSDAE